ncbi:hypothetical protein [Duganella aceris]|uniref:ABC transporter permease n=1 Tax=Duganella aceris TaxID=2703883 RepID=A0ABX0FF47_9BURK|nr:hypothetical protein [Duganella aceris]NGZ83167.1 hypothetical protein [Duganella aceris]
MNKLPLSYRRFRLRMAHHALLRFAASLQSSLEIVLLGFAPVMLGLIACIALPGLLAATRPWPQALALLAGQTLLASAPVWLLRKRLHPAEVLLWSRPLPITPRQRWAAEASVAGLIVGPLSLAYAVSTAIWLYQWPDWLRPAAPQALLLTVLTLLLAWLLSTLMLARRARMPAARKPGRARAVATAYVPRLPRLPRLPGLPGRPDSPRRAPLGYYWRQLFWHPFWRAENLVGIQQTLLLCAALFSVALWLWRPPLVPPALWGACAALALMLLTDRGDKAVAEQIALLRPIVAGWPMRPERLFRCAMLFSLLPGLCVMACFALLTLVRAGAHYSHTVAIVWLCCAAVAQLAVVSLRRLSARGRVGLVFGAILLLTAIGSELWN